MIFKLVGGSMRRSRQSFGFFFDKDVDSLADVGLAQDFAAHGVGGFAVAVHDVVVLDDVFTCVKVEAFDFLLGAFQAFADHAVFDRRVVVDA